MVDSGELMTRQNLRISKTIENIMRAELNRRIRDAMPADASSSLLARIRMNETDPYTEAQALIARLS